MALVGQSPTQICNGNDRFRNKQFSVPSRASNATFLPIVTVLRPTGVMAMRSHFRRNQFSGVFAGTAFRIYLNS